MAKTKPKEVPGFGIRVKQPDGSWKEVPQHIVDNWAPLEPPHGDFDGERIAMDVLLGKPEPKNMSQMEREFRTALKVDIKEAERNGYAVEIPIQ